MLYTSSLGVRFLIFILALGLVCTFVVTSTLGSRDFNVTSSSNNRQTRINFRPMELLESNRNPLLKSGVSLRRLTDDSQVIGSLPPNAQNRKSRRQASLQEVGVN